MWEQELVAPSRALTVRMSGCSDAFSNQLRWCIARDLPTLALHELCIMQTSPFPDEYIAHRLALMPFKPQDPRAATASVHLDVSAPGRVLAHQIEGEAAAMTPRAIVATLPECSFLRFTGKLELGCGKTHQRYNHVAAARVARRSRGMSLELEECWCRDTPPGDKCSDCAGTKCADPSAPIDHVMSFETFGDRSPVESFRLALLITRAKLERVSQLLKTGGNVSQNGKSKATNNPSVAS